MVLNAEETSVLNHVAFRNLASIERDGWTLTGAVTFYQSPVQILDASFVASRSEDALHIVRSRFAIERSVFQKAAFDGIDSDFSEGSIHDARFLDIGNDAIDLSGSVVELRGVVVDGSGDKALSVGERSRITARDMSIQRAEIALASKDSSTVTAHGLQISDGGVGLAAFRKKAEFGPASIDVRELQIETVASPFLAEVLSSVTVDGRQIPATEQDLKQRLYDGDD